MKYRVKPTAKFQKDLKRIQKRSYDLTLLTSVIKKLSSGEDLSVKFRDHDLTGDYSKCRECHIAPDWLLIYERLDADALLYLIRTGTHSDLF